MYQLLTQMSFALGSGVAEMGRLMFLVLAIRWPHELRTLVKISPLKQKFRALQWTKLVGKESLGGWRWGEARWLWVQESKSLLLTKDEHAAPVDNSRVVVTGGWRSAGGEGSREAQGEVSEASARQFKPRSL